MHRYFTRRAAGAALLGLTVALAGCDTLLEVDNPGAIDESDVSDPQFAPEMANAAISEFQENFGFLIFAGAILTDEAVNGHNYEQWQDFDLRLVEDDNTQLADIYEALQSARATGDDMTARLREVLDAPQSSKELATALTYAGVSYTYLAEYFCYAPVEVEAPAIRSGEIFERAVTRLDEGIDVAQAAGATQILNLARVFAARASLGAGNLQDAIAYASAVPAEFESWVQHTNSPTSLRNYFWTATTGTNTTIGVDVYFRDLGDTRVLHVDTAVTGHNQKTLLWLPYQSASYSEWTAGGEGQLFGENTAIRLASGLEARYILAEAGGMSDTELRAFIDERRAVGGQDPFTGTDLQAELRDQRRRDFFLDGHRLGDIRRYLERDGIDFFPSGAHPNDEEWGWGDYQTATCFVPHRDEAVGNPNYIPLD